MEDDGEDREARQSDEHGSGGVERKKRKKKKRKKYFFFKQKTAYEIYQCDWSSDVCSSDLLSRGQEIRVGAVPKRGGGADCRVVKTRRA